MSRFLAGLLHLTVQRRPHVSRFIAAVALSLVGAACAVQDAAGPAVTFTSSASVASLPQPNYRFVSAAGQNACAVTSTGIGYCWGHGAFGQLGTGGTTAWADQPQRVLGSPWDTIVVSHYTTCGLKGGRAACWGSDAGWGALGQGSVLANCPSPIGGGTGCRLVPKAVAGNHVFVSLSAGGNGDRGVGPPYARFACGIEASGQAFCWGSDGDGELGDGTQYPNANPTPIPAAVGVTWSRIWSGMDHSCGLDRNGKAYCWGAEMWGEIGDDAPPPQQTFTLYGAVPTPSPVLGGLTFRQVDAGRVHSCGVTTAGEVYCWGYNGSGHLGAPTVDCSTDPRYPLPCSATPVKVQSTQTFTYVTTGLAHSCALATTGAIWCWGVAGNVGAGNPSQLGVPCPANPNGRCVLTPIQTQTSVRFKQLDAGMNFTCAVSTTQKVYCWGTDFYGLAKTGTAEFTPTMINPPAN